MRRPGVIVAGGGVIMLCALPPWSLRMETQTSLIVWLSGLHPPTPTPTHQHPSNLDEWKARPVHKAPKVGFLSCSSARLPTYFTINPTHRCHPADCTSTPRWHKLMDLYSDYKLILILFGFYRSNRMCVRNVLQMYAGVICSGDTPSICIEPFLIGYWATFTSTSPLWWSWSSSI